MKKVFGILFLITFVPVLGFTQEVSEAKKNPRLTKIGTATI
jgi:hypothetical protein